MSERSGVETQESRQRSRRNEGQLRLLPGAEPARDWILDERTRRVGRSGVAQARDALHRARPPEPHQPESVRKAS